MDSITRYRMDPASILLAVTTVSGWPAFCSSLAALLTAGPRRLRHHGLSVTRWVRVIPAPRRRIIGRRVIGVGCCPIPCRAIGGATGYPGIRQRREWQADDVDKDRSGTISAGQVAFQDLHVEGQP